MKIWIGGPGGEALMVSAISREDCLRETEEAYGKGTRAIHEFDVSRSCNPELCAKLKALIAHWRKEAEDVSLDYYASQYNTSDACADALEEVLKEFP